MTINNEKNGEMFEKFDDYKNYDYDLDEDMEVYADATLSQSSSENGQKKSQQRLDNNNLSPDEGVGDLNSAEACPSLVPAKKATILASLRSERDVGLTEPDAYSQVITFKRAHVPQLPSLNRNTKLSDEYSSVNETSTPVTSGNSLKPGIRFFRRFFFPNGKNATPKRQQSQTSTGTTSSYLSSTYSSGDHEDATSGDTSSKFKYSFIDIQIFKIIFKKVREK